jgi:hypothetical protein
METTVMGVKTGCTPRSDVLQGELNDAIFAASFGQLIRDEGPAVYRPAAEQRARRWRFGKASNGAKRG